MTSFDAQWTNQIEIRSGIPVYGEGSHRGVVHLEMHDLNVSNDHNDRIDTHVDDSPRLDVHVYVRIDHAAVCGRMCPVMNGVGMRVDSVSLLLACHDECPVRTCGDRSCDSWWVELLFDDSLAPSLLWMILNL